MFGDTWSTREYHIPLYHLLCWLVVWNMNFMTFHSVGNVIIPTDELIFFRGVGIPPTSSHYRCSYLHYILWKKKTWTSPFLIGKSYAIISSPICLMVKTQDPRRTKRLVLSIHRVPAPAIDTGQSVGFCGTVAAWSGRFRQWKRRITAVCSFVGLFEIIPTVYIYICTYTLYNMYIPIKDVIKIYKHNLCQLFFCPKTMRLQSRPDQLLGASKSGTWGFHGSWKNPTKRENMDDLYMFILENLIQMDDLGMFISWKIPFKWMIWRYPQFRKPHGIWIEDDIGEMR